MPTYTLEHKETGEQHDVLMSWNDFEEHKKLHPQFKQVITQVNIGDPVNLGLRKVPTEFEKNTSPTAGVWNTNSFASTT